MITEQEKLESEIAVKKSIQMKNIATVLVELKINGLLEDDIKNKLLKQIQN